MKDEKRTPRTYKAKDSVYKKAMRRAKKEKGKLSNVVENVVIAYAAGLNIKAVKTENNDGRSIDIFTDDFSVRLNDLNK
jgi:hypothetical protein